MEDRAARLADFGDFLDREDGSRLVVRPHRRDEDGAVCGLGGVDFCSKLVEVDLSDAVYRKFHCLEAECLEAADGLENRRVLDCCRYHLEVLAEPVGSAAYRGVVGLSCARSENDLFWRAIEEGRDLFSRPVHEFRHLSAERVHRARVAVEIAEKRQHYVFHLGGDRRRGIVVEIDCLLH